MAAASASIALSCPKITSLRLRSRFFSTSRSEVDTLLAGMRAMRATTSSMWRTSTSGLALGDRLQAQPRAGLVDHVDGLVGQVPLVDVPRGELGRRLQRLVGVGDAVVLLEARLEAHAGSRRSPAPMGSTTSIFWKRRASAWSFSKMPRYSW